MIFATSVTPHLFWITSRAAGIVALVLASLAVALGLVMSLKLARRRGPDLLALHEVLSLGTLVAIAVHGVTLLGDSYLKASVADITVPFLSSYRTLWTSLGIIAGWGLAVLGLSFYLRRYIGVRRWRRLHRFTALLWLAGLAHSLGEGTDAGQLWFLAMIAVVAIPAALLLVTRYWAEPAPPNARRADPPRDGSRPGGPGRAGVRRGGGAATAPAGGARRNLRTPRRPAPSASPHS